LKKWKKVKNEMDIENELNKELKLLQKEFGCAEVTVRWQPRSKTESEFFGKQKFVAAK